MATKTTPPKKRTAAKAPKIVEQAAPSYRVAATRDGARSIAGHYPTAQVQAFRVLAAAQDKDVQQLLAEGINCIFERYGVDDRIPLFSGRRTRAAG